MEEKLTDQERARRDKLPRYEEMGVDPYGQRFERSDSVKSAREKIPDAVLELPYDGAKEMLLVDEIEDREFLRELIEAMYDELPEPKKKK